MRTLRFAIGAALLALVPALCAQLQAQNFNLVVGDAGNGVNLWPAGEAPNFAIDQAGQKYLNFGEFDTGFIVTPSLGSTVADGITLWPANDAEPRDPASFELYGTNVDLNLFGAFPGDSFPLADFSLIASGDLALPSERNGGGTTDIGYFDPANATPAVPHQTVDFVNTDAYSNYLVLFPTVKDADGANSMQIAEVALWSGGAGGTALLDPFDAIVGVQKFETFDPIGPVDPQPEPTAGNWSVRMWRPNSNPETPTTVSGTAGADTIINDPSFQFQGYVADGMTPMINLADTGGAGGGYSIPLAKEAFPGDTPTADDGMVMRAVAKVIIPEDGQYTFGFDGDDGVRLTLSGADFTLQGAAGMAAGEVLEFPDDTGNALTLGSTFMPAGEHDIEVVWNENGGGAFVEVFASPGIDSEVNMGRDDFAPIGLTEAIEIGSGTTPGITGVWNIRQVQVDPSFESSSDGVTGLNNLTDAETAIGLTFANDPIVVDEFDFTAPVLNINDGGGDGRFTPGDASLVTGDHYATQGIVTVSIEEAGDYIFGFGSDDGASLTLEGADFTILNPGGAREIQNDGETMAFVNNTGNSDTFGTTFLEAGEYELSFLSWERGGGAWAEVYAGIGADPLGILSAQLLGLDPETLNLMIPAGLQLAGEPVVGEGIPGDYNNSGQVEQGDLDFVLLNWGDTIGDPESIGWTNDLPDGVIDQGELDGVLLNWGNTAAVASAAVPEPSTLAMLILVAAGLLATRVARR